jgi:hypothetical protein
MEEIRKFVIIPAILVFIYFLFVYALGYRMYISPFVDVMKTGPLGDTIGGIMSPLVGIITIYTVYVTYRQQSENSNFVILKDEVEKLYDKESGGLEQRVWDVLSEAYFWYKDPIEARRAPTTGVREEDMLIPSPESVIYFLFINQRILNSYLRKLETIELFRRSFGTHSLGDLQRSVLEQKMDLYIQQTSRISEMFSLISRRRFTDEQLLDVRVGNILTNFETLVPDRSIREMVNLQNRLVRSITLINEGVVL